MGDAPQAKNEERNMEKEALMNIWSPHSLDQCGQQQDDGRSTLSNGPNMAAWVSTARLFAHTDSDIVMIKHWGHRSKIESFSEAIDIFSPAWGESMPQQIQRVANAVSCRGAKIRSLWWCQECCER